MRFVIRAGYQPFLKRKRLVLANSGAKSIVLMIYRTFDVISALKFVFTLCRTGLPENQMIGSDFAAVDIRVGAANLNLRYA